jgi:transcriptional regulator with XRE-family HTH domain
MASKSVGRALRALRQKAGLQATALARAADVSQGTLTRLEKDERQGIHLATACRLAVALGVSVDEFAAQAGLLDLPDVVPADVKGRGPEVAQAIGAAQKRLKAAAEDLSRAQASLKRRK